MRRAKLMTPSPDGLCLAQPIEEACETADLGGETPGVVAVTDENAADRKRIAALISNAGALCVDAGFLLSVRRLLNGAPKLGPQRIELLVSARCPGRP